MTYNLAGIKVDPDRLPTIEHLQAKAILEAARVYHGLLGPDGVEPDDLEFLVRLVLAWERKIDMSSVSNP